MNTVNTMINMNIIVKNYICCLLFVTIRLFFVFTSSARTNKLYSD